jgi:hypothetical protein
VRILFVLDRRVNAGSIQAVAGYLRAADDLGYAIALLGAPERRFRGLRTSSDVEAFDHVVIILESTLNWLSGLTLSQLLTRVPRERRTIVDADGLYNDVICVDHYDRNHPDEASRLRWKMCCEALSDRVFQPTLHPASSKVMPLLFYGYQPAAHVRHSRQQKTWDVLHIGHNWWRWKQIGGTLLPALERIRPRLGEICFIGSWWDGAPSWASAAGLGSAFQCDPEWMRRLGVQIEPPVPFEDVVETMSAARINIMTQRPLFQRLGFVTSKYFEVFCADTIPLIMLPPDRVEEVYGCAGREFALCNDIEDKLLDVLNHPRRYQEAADEVRRHLGANHCYRRRLEELVAGLESEPARVETAIA